MVHKYERNIDVYRANTYKNNQKNGNTILFTVYKYTYKKTALKL